MEKQKFRCRVCGETNFQEYPNKYYYCTNCSVMFFDPEQFSLPEIKFAKFDENAKMPERAHETDSGYDIFSCEEKVIRPQTTELIKTGIAIEFPRNIGLQVRPRSGMAKKNDISITNAPGTVDPGYRNQIGVLLRNNNPNEEYRVKLGAKIAQIVFEKPIIVDLIEINKDKFNKDTDRGLTGYGDSGE